MHLREIQLENFKSFGRKVRIPFLEGFTAITGPNGSGKSNISDAILFVLGPKSPKVIRAGKLTDLIFNGGKEKRPAKFTKVSLIFDNKDRTIPHDADEVVLTRLVKISPSAKDKYLSYFYVNGRTSQMSHFQMLLDHARISADGYNIVQQGDVTRLVSMGSVERRRIFDSLAGITQYDEDIHKAQNEQKHTESNIEKVDIILNELEMSLKQLKKERNEAMRRKELQDLKAECSVKLEYRKRHELQIQMSTVAANLQSIEQKIQEFKDSQETARRDKAVKEKDIQDVEKEIKNRGGEEVAELEEKVWQVRLDIIRGKDSIENCNDRIAELKEEIANATNMLNAGKKDRKKIADEMAASQAALDKKKAEHDKKAGKLKEIEDRISKGNQEVMRLQKEEFKVKQSIEAASEKKHELSLKEDRLDNSLEGLRTSLGQMEEELKIRDREVKDAEFMIKELTVQVGGGKSKEFRPLKELQADFQKVKNQEAKLSQEGRELEAVIDRLSREYQRLKTEKLVHERAQQGGSPGVDMIMQAKAKGDIKGIVGTIAELANVDKEYETALSIVAGRRMQAVVVNDDEVAQQCIDHLKSKRGGRTTFLPLNKLTGGRPQAKALMVSKDQDSLGFAIDLIDFDEKYANAFWYVFRDTVVMKDLRSARKHMGGVMLVTLQGEVLDPGGAMTGGGAEGRSKITFGKKEMSQLEKKEEELNKATEAAHDVTEQLRTAREQLDKLEREIKDRTSKEGEVYDEIEKHKLRQEEFTKKYDTLFKTKQGLDKRIEGILAEIEATGKQKKELDARIEEMERSRLELRKAVTMATPEKVRKEVESLKKAVDSLADEMRDLQSAVKTGAETIKIYDERLTELDEAVKKHNAGIKENQDRTKELKKEIAQKDQDLRAVTKVYESLSKELDQLNKKREKLHDEITKLEFQISGFQDKLTANTDLRIKYNTEFKMVEAAVAEAEAIIRSFEVKYGEDEVAKFPPSDELAKTIRDADMKMERMGPVNMMAIQQFEQKDQRKKELEEEKGRLLKHRDHLVTLVENFITKKKDGFFKVFDAVNENFKEVYKEISGGGEAELVLEDPKDPFAAGLTIKARPPGKKVHRVEALSGGEKSLTSLAFIFAIQDYLPSPFYLLDEIDQNLDAINAEKVAQMVKKNSRMAQFLVVSLHKVTLKEANHVYGVTIQNSITDIIGNVNISELPEMDEINKELEDITETAE